MGEFNNIDIPGNIFEPVVANSELEIKPGDILLCYDGKKYLAGHFEHGNYRSYDDEHSFFAESCNCCGEDYRVVAILRFKDFINWYVGGKL